MGAGTSLSLGRMLDWLDGQLSTADAAEVAAAVESAVQSGDEETKRTLAWLQAFLSTSQLTPLQTPSAVIRSNLRRMFEEGLSNTEHKFAVTRHIALLANDQAHPLQRVGMRSAVRVDLADPQQIIFTTALADVAVNLSKNQQDISLQGQVFPNAAISSADLTVQLLNQQGSVEITSTTPQGYFIFANLLPDIYQVIVSADQFEIETGPIMIQL